VSSETTRAFWVEAPGRGSIRDETLRPPVGAEALVRTRYSSVSRGTEALVFNGNVPPAEYQRMRAPFQEGEFPAPVKFGYCNVGEVEAGPAELIGQAVFSLYPHQTRFVVPSMVLHPVPCGVPLARAVLGANMETALNGVWDAEVRPGDRVAVVGGGTVGCLAAWLASRIAGCEVCLVDTLPARAQVAVQLGVRFALVDEAPREQDVVIHASGSPEGLTTALRLAGFESVVTELSWFGSQPVALPLGEAFHARRLTIRSSQVGHVATSQRTRWDRRRRMQLALSLLAAPELDALISGESAFEELPQVMHDLASGTRDALCHRIRY
jgi:threonine dehydrogenase-like Zn-dependent dehydrogenase